SWERVGRKMHLDFGFLAEERFQKEEHLFRRQEAGGLQDPSNSTANITFPFTQPRQQLWPASLPVGGNQSIQVRYVSQLGERRFVESAPLLNTSLAIRLEMMTILPRALNVCLTLHSPSVLHLTLV